MKKIFILFFSFYSVILFAENTYPQKDFISPIDYKITLSGNFGELRKNHFHSGIDIRTDGVIGKKIHAIADGYISRVKVSPTGFGKAIYIRHKNGYTSVYGHLNNFSKEVDAWVKSKQYERESFSVDLYPKEDQFVFKQGELIAISGNSGGSEGPHLHFEIRETRTEKPVNPIFFGFKIVDKIRPKITGFKVYPLNKRSKINGKNSPKDFKILGSGLSNHLKRKEAIEVSGSIGFSIKVYDLMNDSYSKTGVYSIQLFIDSNLIYEHKLEKFSFAESKYINSLIDYPQYIDHKQRYQRSLRDEGNQLSIIQTAVNDGVVLFNDSLIHTLVYVIKDVHGNASRLTCKLKSKPSSVAEADTAINLDNWFQFDKENTFITDDVRIAFKAKSFYKSLNFEFSKRKPEEGMFSDIVDILRPQIPVHRSYTLELKTKNLPEKYKSKALIVNLDNAEPSAIGGVLIDDFVKASPSQLGSFAIMIDTIAPEITALNIHSGKKIHGYKKISFEVKDDLSGINTYRASLNNKWILMEYDPKVKRLVYYIDEHMKKGKNKFSLEVTDGKKNNAKFEAEVYY